MNELAGRLRGATHPVAVAAAIQEAIDARAAAGGGLVTIPPGLWTITTLVLRSGIRLRLEHGCTLLAHPDLDDYPRGTEGHNKDRQPYHLIRADDCQDVAIEGPGAIDGNAYAFWDPPLAQRLAQGQDVSELLRRRPFQVAYPHWWIEKERRISPLIELCRCRNVRITDLAIRRSPGWTVHAYCCDQAIFRGVVIENDLLGPNTDGFDLNGCRDVVVSDCRLACGDDAIILKSTTDARSCERVTVSNCILATNCAALGLGAESAHAIRDIAFTNCAIRQALRIVQIEMWDPGLIENVAIGNLVGSTLCDVPLERPIYIDIQHLDRTDGRLGHCRNVAIANCAFTTRGRIVLTAADGATIDGVTLSDIHLTYPEIEDAARTVPASRSVQMSNSNPLSRAINAALVADNVRNLHVRNLHCRWPGSTEGPAYHAVWCRNSTGLIDAPALTASRAGHPTMVRDDEGVAVRAPR
jgi:polygalacturonase